MTSIAFWCGRTFLKTRWNIEGIPCETDEEFEAALANSKNIQRVWDGDNCFYEVSTELAQEWQGVEYTEMWFDELRYIKFKRPKLRSLEEAVKPRTLGKQQSVPFWANDWRKKHKR